MKRRKEKKSESLDIRLPFEQKREFMDATRKRGETASNALRGFIANYIEEARLAEQPNPVQEITMTLARHRFKTIATAAGAALGVFSVTALPSAADSTAFEALDKNNDGMITEGEILPGEDADIIAKLDTDGSGGVSREELEAAGNRIVIKKTSSDGEDDGQTVTKKTVKILEFSDSKDGEIRGEVSTNVEKRVVVKRIDGGEELSEAELSALLEQALSEAGVEDHGDVEIDVIVEQIIDKTEDAAE
ncbi:MAG: EF-hand domain-containing protein [Henriciella sp.]|jgi:EF hand|nr:EF-hand domain-containing protein [Henriciella sp.]MBO6695609.1 EF-hand domain-containing protein [Henriciella sp.]